MKRIFTSFFFLFLFVVANAQWTTTSFRGKKYREDVNVKHHFSLDISLLRSQLANAQEMGSNSRPVIISLPTVSGKVEKFAVYSFPVVAKEIADRYQLGSYVGTGVDDPSKYLRFSLAPNDFQSMIIGDGQSEFIEPVNTDKTVYGVFPKTVKGKDGYRFNCSTEEGSAAKTQMDQLFKKAKSFAKNSGNFARSSDKKYRTLRIAISTTAEYTTFFGGTAGALTQVNATLTRVNGVFEKDLALHMNLQNYPTLIYTNAASDPYDTVTNAWSPPNSWNGSLQNTLTTVVGNANYDIGHLFGASGGGGNAGCIGCICVNPTGSSLGKGAGITSPATGTVNASATAPPSGDTFDIDYVAHEIGHQLGANHTFSHDIQGSATHMEPGSGSTIMGYAGITGTLTDVQNNSDPYYHAASIIQIENNLQTKTCDVETSVANNPPVIAPFQDYTIPKGTAFVLTANATDPENNPMTYTWEEFYNASVPIDRNNLGNTTSGASFRSKLPTTSPTRYFPSLPQVMNGVLNNANYTWESVSSVARSTAYVVTVRDNSPAANQQQTDYDGLNVTVHNNGPFIVTTNNVYFNGPSNITWNVVGTNAAPFNVNNVKIDYTTNNGTSWTVITNSTPNDGTESINIPGLTNGATIKIRVSSIDNIFYAVGTATVTASPACSSTPTTGLAFSNITTTTAVATWDISTGATYSIQYRPQGTTAWTTVTSTTNSVTLTGLTSGIVYDVQVANVCGGVAGAYSTIGNFITATVSYCAITSPGATPGYISEVTVTATNANTMTSTSGVPTSPYTDYTTDYSRLITLVRASTGNTLRVAKVMTPTTSTFAVAAWIDYNRNGVFEASERIVNTAASATNPVTASFNIGAGVAYAGPETVVMRVIMSRTAVSNPAPCGVISTNGEIEDYPVRFVDLPTCSTTTPPANVLVQNVTASTAQVSWWGSASATYSVQYRPVTTPASAWITVTPTPATATSYLITGMTDNTQYEVQVANICAGVTGVYSTPVSFTTPVLSYCSAASVANTGYISRVRVAPTNSFIMDNPSGPANYTLYNNPITFYRGVAVNYQVEKSWTTSTQNNLATIIWIDWNRNGTFETTERIVNSGASTANVSQSTLTPTTAFSHPTLKTRMRVMVSDVVTADPCYNPAIGEVEDYDVSILDLPTCTTAAPSNITVTGVTPVAATVSWSGSAGATYLISYNPGPTGGWSTPVAATNPYTITGLTEGTSYQVRVTTICGGVTGPASTPVPFTTPTVSYCDATSTVVQSSYISKVTVTPNQTTPVGAPEMMNASVQNSYTLYSAPAQRVYLVRGSTGNLMKVNRQWLGAATAMSTSVWIDFNRDGNFDTSERVLNASNSTADLVQQSFAVPATASGLVYMGTQTTRMRVVHRDLANPPACGTFDNGEVEDYDVQLITAPTTCSTAAPSNITVTNVTHNSATVSWSSTPGATYDIRWSTSPTGPWLPTAAPGYASTTNNTFVISGANALNEQTTYYVQVRSKCSASTGAWSSNVSFTTTEPQYCYAYGSLDTDYIGKVVVNPAGNTLPTMTNASSADNYISYVNDPTKLIELEYGTNGNIIEVSKAWSGAVSTAGVGVWIDFNRNGTFDAAERILTSAASTTTPVFNNNFAVTVPPAAYQGPYNTTMRVVLRKGTAVSSACGSFNNGEVEDYAVKLKPCSIAMPTNVVINNITHTSAVISWTEPTPGSSFMIEYRETPSGVWIQVPATSNPFTLTGLNPAVSYEVRIAGTCGVNFGAYTTPIPFTTRCDPSPVQVTVTNITPYTAQASWPAVGSTTYTIEIREVGTTPWIQLATGLTTSNYNINNLDPYTTYEIRVATTCVGETTLNPFSNPVVFTTERICEIAPPGLTIITLTATTAEVTWDPFPGATYVLRYRKVGLSSWTTVNVSTNTHTLTGLSELTRYEMQVANVCNGTVQNFTEPYYFTTPTVNYCPMESSTANNFISNVSVYPTNKPQMINASAASTYTNYTGNPLTFIELEQGSTGNRISIGKSISGNSTVGVAVWIDFNRNGQFDIDEKILSSGPDTAGTSESVFSVPNDAFISMSTYTYVTMRVALSKDGVPVSCLSFPDGEVEDYTVRISKKGIDNTVDQTEILIYPNPVSSVLNIKNISKRAKYKIYNAAGQLVGDGTVLNNQINVSKLISGVYVIDINDEINNVTAQRKFIKE